MALKKNRAYAAKAHTHPVKVERPLNVTISDLPVQNASNRGAAFRYPHPQTGVERTTVNKKRIPILVLEYLHEDWLTGNTLYCLGRDPQWEIHFVSYRIKSAFRFLSCVKSYHYFPEETGGTSFTAFVKKLAQKTGANVLVPTSTPGFQYLMKHKETLESFINVIPTPEQWAYEIASDKGKLAAFMSQHDIPAPLTLFDLTHNLKQQLETFPFPVLLKPKTGSGGKGASGEPPITLFTDKKKLLRCIHKYQIADRYVIQSFTEGYEVDCNVLYKEGKLVAYTIQKAVIKTTQFAPSPGLEFIDNEEAIKLVDVLLSKLQWNGVAHVDLIYDNKKQQLQILEINPRFWQTIGASMVGANVNFPSLICRLALNKPVEKVPGKLGKYVPLLPYLKYKLAANAGEKTGFRWTEIDVRYFFTMLPIKTYRLFKAKFNG